MPAVIVIVVVTLLIPVLIYNSLIRRKNQVLNVFATIVKGYSVHERTLLDEITRLRSEATSSRISDDRKVELDNSITKALARLMLVVENYPNLKASDNFMHLQRTLTELEEQISAARRAYNAAVIDYNNAVEMFPTSIVASMMNYKRRTFFEIPAKERAAVDVAKTLQQQKS